MWNIDSGNIVTSLTWESNDFYWDTKCVQVLSSTRVATGGQGQRVFIWNIVTNPPTKLFTMSSHWSAVNDIDILSDGNLVSVGDDANIVLWNTATGNQIYFKQTPHTDKIFCVKTLANGYFASGSADNTIKIWNPAAMTSAVTTLTGHTGDVNVLDLMSNGYLVSGSSDQYVIVWDPSDWSQKNKFKAVNNNVVTCLREISPNVIATAGLDSTLYIWMITGTNTQNNIGSVSNAFSGTKMGCRDMLLYNNSILAIATNNTKTDLYNVENPLSVSYMKSLTISQGSFAYQLANLSKLL